MDVESPERRERRRKQKLLREKQIRRQKVIIFWAFAAVLLIGVSLAVVLGLESRRASRTEETAAAEQAEKEKAEYLRQQAKEENTIHLTAVGDNLIHEHIYQSGIQESGEWDYDQLYQHIKDKIISADLSVVNQECIFVADHDNVSAYPEFGSPTEIGDALVDTGFDVVLHATNHAMDKGTQAIEETLAYWKKSHPEITVLGIHENQEAADQIATVECKGVTFAMLNYTCQINGEDYGGFPGYMLDVLDMDKVSDDIQKAKEAGDMVIVFLHIGTEYASEPDQEVKDYLQLLLSQGADIAICSHPHVLQNFETLKDGQGNEMLVYYSLGNFISTQKEPECMLGGMADITISRDPKNGELSISDAQLEPIVTHYNHEKGEYAVYPLEDYTEELAEEHGIHEEASEPFTLETLTQQYEDVLKQEYDTLAEEE
ncbi:MAG: CapA family protein [Ruminococcus sp.]|jgi:hypothetical protein